MSAVQRLFTSVKKTQVERGDYYTQKENHFLIEGAGGGGPEWLYHNQYVYKKENIIILCMYSRFSRGSTAKGSSTTLVTIGHTKV